MMLFKEPKHSVLKPVEGGSAQKVRVDYILLGAVLALSLFGLLMIFDASQFESFAQFGNKYYFIGQQIVWMVIGLFLLAIFALVDYHLLQKVSWVFFISSIVLLFLVFIPKLGVSAGGAHRWLKVAFLTVQPAELIKLSTIIFFADLLQTSKKNVWFFSLVGLVVFVIGFLQRDLGTAIVFVLISLSIYFVSGAQLKYLGEIFILGLLGLSGFILTSAYRRQRVLAFLDPFSDPQGFSYHISQILIALGSGGLFGLGIGQSRQKFAYIPEVTTDSIFSVVGEELGFLGSLVLIGLISLLVFRCFKVATAANDRFGQLLAVGLTAWLGSQAIVNLAAMVSLIPLTGVPLPFISYGGSALLANLVAAGILLNISKNHK